MRLDQVMSEFPALATENEHFEFYWFPYTGPVHHQAQQPLYRPLGAAVRLPALARRRVPVEHASSAACCAAGHAPRPRLTKTISRVSGSVLSGRTYTDRSDRVFTSPRRVRFVEMEYAVPREALAPALREITETISESAGGT